MTNNDVLRRVRYIFDLSDSKMISIFAHIEVAVTREQISAYLKKDEDPDYLKCQDKMLANFLNGLIIEKRGKQEGPLPQPESRLTNNIVFRKLKIALKLQSDDVLHILDLANLRMSAHELSAFFRNAKHKNYRECQDQILRNFLQGLQMKFRPAEGAFNWDAVEAKVAEKQD